MGEDSIVAHDVGGDWGVPFNTEAEQAVLGGILIRPEQFEVIEGRLTPEDFYIASHQVVFRAMCSLRRMQRPIDPIVLREELTRMGELENVGGADWLFALTASRDVTGSHTEHYSQIVIDKSILRKLHGAGSAIAGKVLENTDSVSDVLDFAERQIFGISESRCNSNTVHISEIMASVVDGLTNGESVPFGVVETGYPLLDDCLVGFQPGELILIAARPSMGKTTLALNFVHNAAINRGLGSLFFTIEMTAKDIYRHLLIINNNDVPADRIRHRNLTREDMRSLEKSMDALDGTNIYVDNSSVITIGEMRSIARRCKTKHGIQLIVVDYLQLIKPSAQASRRSREQEVSEISQGLKLLAKELDIPIIALSQLSRSPEKRQDGRPYLSDLRDSGSLEQDADVVIMLHRKENGGDKDIVAIDLLIAKNRKGPTGTVPLLFRKDILRFDSPVIKTDNQSDDF